MQLIEYTFQIPRNLVIIKTRIVMSLSKKRIKNISVSELKTRLLEVVRAVERGETYEITKGKKPVAKLIGLNNPLPVTGFSQVKISGDIISPLDAEWSFDIENIDTTLRGPK